jgi:hypothetical protein
MKTRFLFFILITAALVVLTACSAAPTPLPTPTPLPNMAPTETETPWPSAISDPTNTLQPTATIALTPTSTLTATSTSTPRPTFAGFQVEYAEYSNYGLNLTFRIPGIKQRYRLDVNGAPFTCNLLEKYPDRLYCVGAVIAPNTQVSLRFLPLDGGNTPIYETTYRITPMLIPTPDVRIQFAAFKEKCPGKEANITCETEYRVNGKGCCVVATCIDACGNTFSANSCPQVMELKGICQGKPPIP